MIKDNQKYFNGLHVFLDALAIAGSYILAWYLKFEGPFVTEGAGALPMGFYFSALYFLVPGYLILYYWFKLYTPKRSQTLEKEILDIFPCDCGTSCHCFGNVFQVYTPKQLCGFY